MSFTDKTVNSLTFLVSDEIPVTHGFTTRYGGVSRGIYESLDLGERLGDEPDNVKENYRRMKAALGIAGDLVYSKQVHGTVIRRADRADARRPYDPIDYEADGLVTDEEGLPLIIFAADCIPILLYDGVRKAVGAVHAGWRGTAGLIARRGVEAMVREFGCKPGDIRAAVGPGIGPCCYEVGADVADALVSAAGRDAAGPFLTSKGGGKYMADLKGFNAMVLRDAGVERVDVCPECTMCMNTKYWSHRYTRGQRGVQGAVISL